MQTRKALGVFNKSAQEDTKVSKDLSDSADKFLKQYDDREKYIASRKHQYEMSLPFVEALKNKIAKVTKTATDESMPVIGTFEIYSAIKRVAERSSSDRGLKRLALHLEKSWHDNKSGSVTYGQLRSLVAVYKDQFPKSKAVDALQSECARLGYHKLPVAKLTRIASKIKNQSDYDIAMEVNDLAGDRPEQIRSREFIRAMAERSASLASESSKDHRSASERVLDRMASIDKEADLMGAIEKMKYAKEMAASLIEQLNLASQDMFEDGLDSDGQALNDLADQLGQWSSQLSSIDQSASGDSSAESMPSSAAPQSERMGPDVPLWDRKTFSGPSPSERAQESQDAGDLEGAGMSKKWWDPRTWSFGKMSNLLDALDAATALVPDRKYARILEKFAQMLPPPEEFGEDELLAPPAEDSFPPVESPADLPSGMPSDALPSSDVDTGDLAQAVDMMRDVEELVQDEAPPSVQNYIDHEMAEGHHTALPGSSAWGAEEVLFEDHQSPPPSEQWLAEEEAEILGEPASAPMPPPEMPIMAAKKTKGMPLPGKIKSQPNQERKLKFGPSDAARVLKASYLENALLAGKKIVAGRLSMFVNDNDEIELWRGGSGRAASLKDIDTVIADFRRMAQLELSPPMSTPAPAPMPSQPPMQVSELPGASGGSDEDDAKPAPNPVPLNETIAAALTNYKSQGMNFLEAMKEFNKEHGARMEEWGPTADTSLISVAQQLWSGDMAGMPMLATKSAAGLKVPKINKPKDAVKPQDLGKDTSQNDGLPSPGKINQSVKPKGKLSPTDLGKDTSQNDGLPSPGKPNANPNDPKGKPGVKLPNKNLGKTTDGNEGFKTPALGSKPSAKQAQVKSDMPPNEGETGRTLVSTGDGHFLIVSDEAGTRIMSSDDAGTEGEVIALAQGGHGPAVEDAMSGMYDPGSLPTGEPTSDVAPLDVEREVPQADHQPQPIGDQVEHLMGQDGPEPILKKQKQPIDL